MLRKLATLLLVTGSLLAYGQAKKNKKAATTATPVSDKTDYREIGAPLPPFRAVTFDKRTITDTIARSGGNFFLMLFNPTCEHCEEMTRRIGASGDLFKRSRVLLVAGKTMMPYLEYFQATTHYDDYPVLQVAIDSSELIDKTYGYYSLPQINIYSPDRKLIKRFTGEVEIDSLRPYIQ